MTTTEPAAPVVAPLARTVAYFVLLGVSVILVLTLGLAPIWFAAALAAKIVASVAVVESAAGLVAGGLGVAYRPTRGL